MTTLPRFKIHQIYSRYNSSLKSLEQEYRGTAMSLSDYGYGKKRIEKDLKTELETLGSLPLIKIDQAYGRYFHAIKEAKRDHASQGGSAADYKRALKRADEALNIAFDEIEKTI